MGLKKFLKKIFEKKKSFPDNSLPKLKKLQGIANNALALGYGNPFGYITPPFKVEVNLITGKITPDMKGDDVEKFYKDVAEWFPKVLGKEGIPLQVIKEAKIIIEPKKNPRCVIKTEDKTYTSNS